MKNESIRRIGRGIGRFWRRRTLGAAVTRIALILVLFLAVAYILVWGLMVRMPGSSYHGPLPPLSEAERLLAAELRDHVHVLAGQIDARHVGRPKQLAQAAAYIESKFQAAGYDVRRQTYAVRGVACHNLIVEIPGTRRPALASEPSTGQQSSSVAAVGRPDEILVVGAHYDSVMGCPGANDNGSGVAALLALSKRFAGRTQPRTLRFAAFVNEEPPHFQTDDMGSLVYARACRERGDKIIGMISLETIGCYSDAPGSQQYPPPFGLFYPSRGDFIGFVGNFSSAGFVRRVVGSFRRHVRFPSQGAAIPFVPQAGWSDHWSFWQAGYPGLMVTDTAPFRYSHYHGPDDTPEKLDYERMARVVAGLETVIGGLCAGDAP
jgi:hypothetical protein